MEEVDTATKPIRCRAAVARSAGAALVIEDVMVDPPQPHEVRIRIICTSLCHTDITVWKLQEPYGCFPTILGHEAVGEVESVGEEVDGVGKGDIVIPTFIADCGECRDCISKKSNQCSKFPFKISPWMPRSDTSRFKDLNGHTLFHFLFVSSFSEYTVVDAAYVTKINPAAPPDRACLLGCGISTGVGAAWRLADVEQGSTVAIFGLGSIGLAVAEGARLRGASRIIGVDLNPEKFAVGKKLGMTDFIDAGKTTDKSINEIINEMTDGGADYCFECVGLAAIVHQAFDCCRKGGGKTVVVGYDKPGSQLTFDSQNFLLSGKTLIGCLLGGIKPRTDFPILIQRYIDKELQLDEFVTHEVSFEDINKAFDLLLEGKSLRCVIWMNHSMNKSISANKSIGV